MLQLLNDLGSQFQNFFAPAGQLFMKESYASKLLPKQNNPAWVQFWVLSEILLW